MTAMSPPPRGLEIEDLYRLRILSDPQISPDGQTVAYVQTRLRKKKDDYASNIWLVASDGSRPPRKFTVSEARDTSPRWSPRGDAIAFLSTRAGKADIWIIQTDGGEARRLTRLKHGVQEFEWSPDGKWIAFVTRLNDEDTNPVEDARAAERPPAEDDNRQPGQTSEEGLTPETWGASDWDEDGEDEEQEGNEKNKAGARIIERIHYKADGSGYLEGRTQIFVVKASGGKPLQITQGDWDASSPRWSPDGRSLAYLANKEEDAEYRNIQDIFVATLDDSGKPRKATRATRHDFALRGYDWLPDGNGFGLLAHRRLDEAAYGTNAHVWVVDMQGEVRNLTSEWDFSASAELNSDLRSGIGTLRPRYSADGSTVYFVGLVGGTVPLLSVPLAGGEVRQVVGGDRMLLNFTLAGDRIAFGASSETEPNDIYVARADGSEERKLTDVNRDALRELAAQPSHEFTVARADGTRVQGWYILPQGFEEGKKYPLVLEIHGGPHTAYGSTFFHEFQVLASRGYVVVYTNPRGSQGYGQAYNDAIINDWGGVDYEDIMASLDHVVGLGFVDDERLGVGGGSYGGYMTGWIIGHTDRFKAAVASRMVSNLYSAWGSGDFTWMLWNWEMEGPPQERSELYIERSPVHHARKINTPLLITHAVDDLRCQVEQAEQMYVAMKVQKKTVRMVLLPSGGHDVSRSGKPSVRTARLKEIMDWYDRFLLDSEES